MLIFENRTEGHHLHWLRYITEDFLTTDRRITLALDYRPDTKDRIHEHLHDLTEKVIIMSIHDSAGRVRDGSIVGTIAACLKESNAGEVFVNNLDEIASGCLRRAAAGIYPPAALRGKLSGVYFRPRFLENSFWPPGNAIKAIGYRRLARQKWFDRLYLVDEYLIEKTRQRYPSQTILFLPDVWAGSFPHDREEARRRLGIPTDRMVFLSYGIGDRRKGLHLAVQAVKEFPSASTIYLLCAGSITSDPKTAAGLKELENRGNARIMDRYVSNEEQSLCFSASDVVLLPYIRHFGSSGVLSLSAAAGKMVIVSDEGLLARRVREHHLGLLFPSGSVEALRKRMQEAAHLSEADRIRFCESALRFSRSCSREAFRKALIAPFVGI